MKPWCFFLATWSALAFLQCGAKSPSASAIEQQGAMCSAELAHAVLSSANCTEMQLRVDALILTRAECRSLYGDAGLDVCKKVREAGLDRR